MRRTIKSQEWIPEGHRNFTHLTQPEQFQLSFQNKENATNKQMFPGDYSRAMMINNDNPQLQP